MVVVDFISIDDVKAVFEYRPDSETSAPGIIEININSGEPRLIKKSPDDDMPDTTWYVPHAIRCAAEMLQETPIRSHCVRIWH